MYSEQMQGNLNNTKPYIEVEDLRKIHNNLKKESHSQVRAILLWLHKVYFVF